MKKKPINWKYYWLFESKWNHEFSTVDINFIRKDDRLHIRRFLKKFIIDYYREHRFFCDVEKWELIKYIERWSDELATKIYENEQKRV